LLLVINWQYAVIADQFQVSASRFHIFRLYLDLRGQELEMEQCTVSESDLQSLPFWRVIDYIDEGDDLANGFGEVQAELRGVFLARLSICSRSFTSSISSGESKSLS
jgi:hypothetical protein